MATIKVGHLNTKHRIAALNAELSSLQAILDRNQTPYYAQPDWFKRITLSGLVKIYGMVSSRNSNLVAGRFPMSTAGASDIWVARANFYIDADVNSWTTAHIAYRGVRAPLYASINDPAAYAPGVPIDEAYITMANFAKSPLYVRAGREYVRFGRYHRDEIPPTLPQMLSQTQADVLELGFVDASGFNGSVYVFRGTPKVTRPRLDINNGGGQIGYIFHQFGFDIDFSLDYLYNMVDVNYIFGTPTVAGPVIGAGYLSNVSAVSAEMDLNYGLFDLAVHFTSAIDSFLPSEFLFKGTGAEPSALYAGAGYTFDTMGHPSRLGISYQHSWEALTVGGIFGAGLGVPESRLQADYTIDMWKNTQLGAHIVYDEDYRIADGGTGTEHTTGLFSFGAMFS